MEFIRYNYISLDNAVGCQIFFGVLSVSSGYFSTGDWNLLVNDAALARSVVPELYLMPLSRPSRLDLGL